MTLVLGLCGGKYRDMVIVKITHGLGNQIFQYAVGRRLAQVLNTELKLDLSFYHDICDDPLFPRPFLLDKFNTHFSVASKNEIEFCRNNKMISEREINFNNISYKGDVYLHGFFHDIRNFTCEEFIEELREEFVLKDNSSERIQEIKKKIKSVNCPVSINVRRGDYFKKENLEKYGVCSFEYYKDSISRLKKKFVNITLFVTSDDMDYVKNKFNNIKKSGVEICYVENLENYEILYLLTFCHHHIIPNSTFAWWIALLGRNKDKMVYSPEPWFTFQPGKPMHFPSWIIIPREDWKPAWCEHYFRRLNPENPTYFIVRRRADTVGLFSNYLVFAGAIRYALQKGYLPVIDMKNYYNRSLMSYDMIGKENVWEWFFLQPHGMDLEEALNGGNVLVGSGELAYPYPHADEAFFMNKNDVLTEWRTLRKLGFLRIRPEIHEEILQQFNKMFSQEDRVLGVRIRGTDRIALRPKYYPVSPPIDYVISTVEKCLEEWGCNKIFLSTEDRNIVSRFEKKFGEKCIVSQQERPEYDGKGLYVDYGEKTKESLYKRGKEYLRDVVMLSMCNSFITHRCSASVAVMMMADDFENVLAFDFGEYGCPSEKEKSTGKDILWRKQDEIIAEVKKWKRNLQKDTEDISWRDKYLDVAGDMDWLHKKSARRGGFGEVDYNFLYPLCSILDEYHPRNILEFEFDQASKITAQYSSSHKAIHTILANNRDRVEHFMRCWEVPWDYTEIHGSSLIKTTRNSHTGVVYQNFSEIAKNKQYDLILLKCFSAEDVYIHMDILSALPGILRENFMILMDHVEDECGNMVFFEMMDILKRNGIGFLGKDFPGKNRLVSALVSESWKYMAEF